jgi:hypothetical protein
MLGAEGTAAGCRGDFAPDTLLDLRVEAQEIGRPGQHQRHRFVPGGDERQ